jgi:hypothetical protein
MFNLSESVSKASRATGLNVRFESAPVDNENEERPCDISGW